MLISLGSALSQWEMSMLKKVILSYENFGLSQSAEEDFSRKRWWQFASSRLHVALWAPITSLRCGRREIKAAWAGKPSPNHWLPKSEINLSRFWRHLWVFYQVCAPIWTHEAHVLLRRKRWSICAVTWPKLVGWCLGQKIPLTQKFGSPPALLNTLKLNLVNVLSVGDTTEKRNQQQIKRLLLKTAHMKKGFSFSLFSSLNKWKNF